MCGITPRDLRLLCENPNELTSGRSYTPAEVGDMLLDQIFFLLVPRTNLRSSSGRRTAMDAMKAATSIPNEDGQYAGVDEQGKPIRARIVGKSKARMLMEEEERKQREALATKDKKSKSRSRTPPKGGIVDGRRSSKRT